MESDRKKGLRPPATGSARQQYNESLRVAVSWKPLHLISTICPSLFRPPIQLLKTFALPLTRRMLTPLVMLRHWARILVTWRHRSYASNGSIFCRTFARWTRHSPPRPHHRRQSWRDQTTFWRRPPRRHRVAKRTTSLNTSGRLYRASATGLWPNTSGSCSERFWSRWFSGTNRRTVRTDM